MAIAQDDLYQPIFTPHIFIEALAANADREVIHLSEGNSLTGRDLSDETSRYVQALRSIGLDKGSRIAVLSSNRIEVMHVMNAAMIEVILLTALHPLGSVDDFEYVVEDAGIDALFFDPKFDALVGELLSRCPRIKHCYAFGRSSHGADLQQLVDPLTPQPLVAPRIDGTEIFRLTYSGGTTGKPKGIPANFRSSTTMVQIMMAEWEWPRDMRQLLVAPLSHTGGTLLLPTLLSGGALYVIPGFEPVAVMEAIERHRINCILMVPTMIYAILDHPRFEEFDLSSIETIIYGASPISVARLQEGIARLGPVFFQFYGQVECPMTISVMRRADHVPDDPRRLASCGRPVPWIRTALLDTNGQEVADGEPGEICVRGPLVMPGYFGKPEQTAEAFRHGWLHTGDVAIRDPDGFMRIVDRAKDMVITGGFNVFPREVEDVLASHPAIAAVAVFGTPDEHWGEKVTAAVVLRPGHEIEAEDLAKFVRAAKGPHQAPKIVHFLDEIPLTPIGKPDKKALRNRYCS